MVDLLIERGIFRRNKFFILKKFRNIPITQEN